MTEELSNELERAREAHGDTVTQTENTAAEIAARRASAERAERAVRDAEAAVEAAEDVASLDAAQRTANGARNAAAIAAKAVTRAEAEHKAACAARETAHRVLIAAADAVMLSGRAQRIDRFREVLAQLKVAMSELAGDIPQGIHRPAGFSLLTREEQATFDSLFYADPANLIHVPTNEHGGLRGGLIGEFHMSLYDQKRLALITGRPLKDIDAEAAYERAINTPVPELRQIQGYAQT